MITKANYKTEFFWIILSHSDWKSLSCYKTTADYEIAQVIGKRRLLEMEKMIHRYWTTASNPSFRPVYTLCELGNIYWLMVSFERSKLFLLNTKKVIFKLWWDAYACIFLRLTQLIPYVLISLVMTVYRLNLWLAQAVNVWVTPHSHPSSPSVHLNACLSLALIEMRHVQQSCLISHLLFIKNPLIAPKSLQISNYLPPTDTKTHYLYKTSCTFKQTFERK